MIGEAKEQLTMWGDWTRNGGNATGLGYKSPSLTLLRRMVGGVVGMPEIGDEIPCKIDGYLGRLRSMDREMYESLRLYYVDRKTYHGVAKAMRIDRRKAAYLVGAGEHWIAGRLDSEIFTA